MVMKFSGEYFDHNNDYKIDQDGNGLDEAEEFVCMMEAGSKHIDLTTQFLQDCIDFGICIHTDDDSRIVVVSYDFFQIF